MKSKVLPVVLTFLFVFFLSIESFADSNKDSEGEEAKNELSLFLGATSNSDGTAFTIGLDYQYRITGLLGIGALIDHAGSDINSTLLGPAAFFHLRNWEITAAPALEFSDSETTLTYRIGLGYEIGLKAFSISPAVNIDGSRGGEFSVVYGLGFSVEF